MMLVSLILLLIFTGSADQWNAPMTQTPANDTEPSQTPANETKPSQTPANDTEPSQTPANETEPSQSPANETKPSQSPANETKPSQTPANDTEPSQSPANETKPSQSPANETKPSQTPANETKPSQTPANETKPSQTPANDTEPSQTPANDTEPSQTPANDTEPSQTPANGSNQTEGAERACSYRDILTHLDLANQPYMSTRPVRNHSRPTEVNIIVAMEGILDVVEKEQKLISRIFTRVRWTDEFIWWDPSQFCGMRRVSVPAKWLWKPDIIIEERLEDDNVRNPYARLYSDGRVLVKNAETLVSSCRMNVYQFPFDTQKCNLTFTSGMYRADEMTLKAYYSPEESRNRSLSVLWGEYEWDFEDFSYVMVNESDYKSQQLVFTITMKRKPVLYIVNLLLPVLFFLCLDMASFLIPDGNGEKLGYKITVLLAVTVLQLILNDILPATSNRLPVIAMYCMGTFFLMLLSLLETVVVTYLLAKDSQKTDKDDDQKEDQTKGLSCWDRVKRSKSSLCFYNVPEEGDGEKESIHELQSTDTEESEGDLKGDSHGFQVILDELRDLEKNLHVVLENKEDVSRSAGYWSRMANRINTTFSFLYMTVVTVFLTLIFIAWS